MRFKIAEHTFSLSIPEELHHMLGSYRPFEYDGQSEDLYRVEVVDQITCQITKTLVEDIAEVEEGMVRVNIYQTSEGLLYDIIMPRSKVVNAQLHIVGEVAQVVLIAKREKDISNVFAFNNAMILSYISFTLAHNTLLLHSSAILKDGQAYLFLGKSGTGKSTHSRMWQEVFQDAELLNDDHPVVRRFADGRVVAYGSPWSGKTHCYRNLSAPLRAIVRIKRAEYNKLTRLSAVRSYASVMTSCTGAQWSEELSSSKVKALNALITSVGCYQMECLPNNEAAECCYETLCQEKL